MKRKILSLILAFAMTVSLFTVGTGAVEPTYGDTAGHWAESSIERWSAYGIIQGSNGQFDPNGQLTCAQLATILAKLLKLPAAKDAGFTDNTADAWYYDAINRCAAAGILNGNGDGTVTPEAPITRERAMVMLARALGIEPIRKPDLTKYTDAAQVSAYAQGYVAALIEAGIVGGVTADELAPQANINRASTVTILDRAISTYADQAGATVKADGKGLVLVVAENVKITGAPEGTKIVVADGATGLTVNGKSVSDDQTYIVPKTEPAKPSSGSSGGYSHSHSYNETTHKCSCGAFAPAVVATIGDETGYLTLKDAVTAATNSQIVKLMKDTSENIIIPNGKTIVIDLNGKKLTNADSHTIVNNGNLTIQGSGTVDNVTHQKAALVNYGTAVLNGGTYTRSLENPENDKDNSGGNSYYTILNDKGGNMTINAGVEVTNVGHFSSMIRNGGDANSSAMSKLTIHGGVFSGGINTVKNDEFGDLTITGGSFSNTSQCVIMNWHKANISGGTFETNEGAETVLFTAKYLATRAIGKLTVTGGTYICKTDQALLCDRYNNNEEYLGTASIAGGTFSRQPEAKYIAAGYKAKGNEDGTWTVIEKANVKLVAQVGVNKYESLADALAAAKDGDTVTLVADTTPLTSSVEISKSITLDLNGKTIETNGKKINVTATGDLTVTGNGIVNNNTEATVETVNGNKVGVRYTMFAVDAGGKLDIENGTFKTKASQIVYTEGATIIADGTFENTADDVNEGLGSSSMLCAKGPSAVLTMNGGSIIATAESQDNGIYGIYGANGAQITLNDSVSVHTSLAAIGMNNTTSNPEVVVTINGGEYKTTNTKLGTSYPKFNTVVYLPGKCHVTINGGTFTAEDANTHIFSVPYVKVGVNLSISNGTFDGKTEVFFTGTQALSGQNEANNIAITGGTFSSDPIAYVAEGYKAVENGDGTWVVREKENKAQVGGKNYEKLSDAIKASNSPKDTITLTANTTVELENGVANEGEKSRNITIKGDGTQTADVITKATDAEGGKLSYQRGSTFTFENMTIQAGEGNFDGIVCGELTFKECTIKGKLTLYGNATFIDCTFDNTMENQYSIWTWGGKDVTFENCTFNTNGKAILLYGQATAEKPTNLTVSSCTFNDRNNGSAGKAAIEIGNDYNATYKLTVTKATVNGFADGKNTGSKLWANKNSMDATHLSVTIDSTKVF